ncbi:MAG: HD domain-containing protein, partial [Elusimicrobia bacterium]|nr:HD domain-containing protein [Elusimicrobiota bacterium]
GLQDIKNKIIRVTDESASNVIFEQDPLRILRAVRQSFQLDFIIESKTYQSMKNKADRIKIVSGERIAEEINKILLLDKPSKAFHMLDDIGLINILFPELKQTQKIEQPKQYHNDDVYNHTMSVLDKIKPDLLLRMASLFHDIGKPQTKSEDKGKISFINHETVSSNLAKNILIRLKYPMNFIKKVCFLIQNHMYPKMYNSQWKDSSVRKFANKLGDNLENIKLLHIADSKNFNSELFDRVKLLEQQNMLIPAKEMFNGNELIRIFNRPAGKWISEVKEYIRNLQFDNPKITKEEVLLKLKKY